MSTRGDDQFIPLLSSIAESLTIIARTLCTHGAVQAELQAIGEQTREVASEVGMVKHYLSELVDKMTAIKTAA